MLRYKTETRPGTTSGQETEWVNSYNPAARTGRAKDDMESLSLSKNMRS